jgi:hypothetical protein
LAGLADAYLIVPTPGLRVVTGRDNITEHSIKADSGADVVRGFCKDCGTWIYGRGTNPKDVESFENRGATTVPIGPLDVPVEEMNKWDKGGEWYTEQRILMKVD